MTVPKDWSSTPILPQHKTVTKPLIFLFQPHKKKKKEEKETPVTNRIEAEQPLQNITRSDPDELARSRVRSNRIIMRDVNLLEH